MTRVLTSSFSLFNTFLKKTTLCINIQIERFCISSVVKMSASHLSNGSQRPPKVEGKLRLYSMEYCPYAQRVRLVLNAKNIPHDIVNINLMDKPDWYFKIHPEGIVPAIDTGSEIILESLIISDFLDEKFPENSLYPKDLKAKNRDQELIQKIDPLAVLFLRSLVNRKQRSLSEWIERCVPQLQEFESELSSRGTTFFGGEKPGMVDYMLWPWGERTEVITLAYRQKLPLFGADQFPLLRQWRRSMLQDPVCKGTYNEPEEHFKIAQMKVAQLRNLPPKRAHL